MNYNTRAIMFVFNVIRQRSDTLPTMHNAFGTIARCIVHCAQHPTVTSRTFSKSNPKRTVLSWCACPTSLTSNSRPIHYSLHFTSCAYHGTNSYRQYKISASLQMCERALFLLCCAFYIIQLFNITKMVQLHNYFSLYKLLYIFYVL